MKKEEVKKILNWLKTDLDNIRFIETARDLDKENNKRFIWILKKAYEEHLKEKEFIQSLKEESK